MKVKMAPHLNTIGGESGIRRVIEAYFKYLPEFGVELVDPEAETYDLVAAHAGILGGACDVAHLHGIYFTADYKAANEEYTTNAYVVQSALSAQIVTVPSSWVATSFKRDMRISPTVLPHGIVADNWKHTLPHGGYVLWNKNRPTDVCSPAPMVRLAELEPAYQFVSTFVPAENCPNNVKRIGVQPHDVMKQIVQQAAVYLSTTKETFGIGILEALAAGVPVLGWAYGGNLDLVEHGVTGYLAQPGNYDDLRAGLAYCTKYRAELSANGVIAAKAWDWPTVVERLAGIYQQALELRNQPVTVDVIIPVYKKSYAEVERAVKSALAQTYPVRVIVVNDGSDVDLNGLKEIEPLKVNLVATPFNAGVANARNYGIALSDAKYICCLDADDQIAPTFVEVCVAKLEADTTIGLAYTKLNMLRPDGSTVMSTWPESVPNYQRQMERGNQIPTCNVFRRSVWERLGGYRQRYAPQGAGEEDAEFWLRIGAVGFKYALASEEPLFIYTVGGSNQVAGNRNHTITDWTAWHPWVDDKRHPFASIAAPANGRSHPVRQYDEPVVSFVIPVAPHHLTHLVDALDSIEAQTYRQWEVIAVFDGIPTDMRLYNRLLKAYPYMTVVENFAASKGAGWARHAGVGHTKGKFVVFLDADDYLEKHFLELALAQWNKAPGVVYTDYVDRAIWDKAEYDKLEEGRKLSYNDRTGEAFIRRYAKQYSWDKAVRQPEPDPDDNNSPFYVWNIVTTLLPVAWYYEVGGFDQDMDTWEDVDLYFRLARAGKAFCRVPEPLVVYRFTSGSRREHGMVRDQATATKFKQRIQYMKAKYKELPIMPCGGCGGGQASKTFTQMMTAPTNGGGIAAMADSEFVICLYTSPNIGMHPVVGVGSGTNYGYHSGGEQFYVHVKDVAARPDLFQPIKVEQPVEVHEEPKLVVVPPPPPRKADFTGMAGVSPDTANKLAAAGIYNAADIVKVGKAGLENAGVAAKMSGLILAAAKKATKDA